MEASNNTSTPPHGLMGLQELAWPWSVYTLLGLGLIFIAFVAWRLWRWLQQSKQAAAQTAVPIVDPWQALQQNFTRLRVEEPWDQPNSEQFFFALSFLLRQAIELKTQMPVTGQTLAEVRMTLQKSLHFSANFKTELLEFLSLAEQLKFAGQSLDAFQAEQQRLKVETWLEQLQQGVL